MGMDLGLEGKTVLITGASRNMGMLAALAFARQGANLAICTSAKMDELNKVADEARALGAKVVAERCNITEAASVKEFVRKTHAALGRVDVAINAAGGRCENDFLNLTVEEWDKAFAVNVTGPMLVCQSVIPLMKERNWGRIINLSGLAAYLGTSPAQAMVKLAIVGLTRGLAREFGPYNITANCIAPGGGQNRKALRPDQPIRRQGKQSEFVSNMLYLASEEAGFITGQCHIEGGGFVMQ